MLKLPNKIEKFEVPHLKVGIISDSQITPNGFMKETEFERNLTRCLETLKSNECSMIIFAGDITNKASKNGYRRYFECFKKVFKDSFPIVQHIMGNHDYYFGFFPRSYYRKIFEEILNQNPFTHYVVNGYHFIGASPTNYSMVNAYSEIETWLEENIKIALEDDPNKPIFITTHNAPKNTVYGSYEWGDVSLGKVFDKYPNIVNFSGHTHYSLLDERSYYNDKYQAFGTQATAYIEMEKGKQNGTIPPLAYTCPMGYIMDFNDTITIHRFDMTNNVELKVDKVKQIYPRIKEKIVITKPEFTKKEYKVSYENDEAYVTFSRATNNDLIHSYKIVIDDKKEQLYFSDFYLGTNFDKDEITLPLYGIEKGEHNLKIYAINSIEEISKDFIEINKITIKKKVKFKMKQSPDKLNYRF